MAVQLHHRGHPWVVGSSELGEAMGFWGLSIENLVIFNGISMGIFHGFYTCKTIEESLITRILLGFYFSGSFGLQELN